MALHMLRSTPPFTKVMRGYDPEEVDEHLRSLDELDQGHAMALEAAEARVVVLTAELDALRHRNEELEASIRNETPRTIAAFGERLTMVLGEAEEAAEASLAAARDEAATVVAEARATATELIEQASATVADAEQRAATRLALAEERASAVEVSASRRADATMDEAETWARNRRVEVEGWAADIRAHIDAERAREAEEFARIRAARTAELVELARRRDGMVDELDAVADGIRRTVAATRAAAASTVLPDAPGQAAGARRPLGTRPEPGSAPVSGRPSAVGDGSDHLSRAPAGAPVADPGDGDFEGVAAGGLAAGGDAGNDDGGGAGAPTARPGLRPFDAEIDLTGPIHIDVADDGAESGTD